MQEAPKTITLVLTKGLEDANTLMAGLGELPAKLSYTLLKDLEEQISKQLSPPAEAETK
jgi:hypothetical protein